MSGKRRLYILLGLFALLIFLYLIGPRTLVVKPVSQVYETHLDLVSLDDSIHRAEAQLEIREGNESQILWADSVGVKSNITFVYIHGFSASHEEGNPLHYRLASYFDANLYLTRLQAHGLETEEALLDFSPDLYVQSVDRAIGIGKELGDTVIVLACSTGGTAALFSLAHSYDVDGLMLYSPNIELADKTSNLLTKPYGKKIAQMVLKGDYREWECPPDAQAYWYRRYRLEALIQLEGFLDHCMTQETFSKVHEPVFLAYYYKDKDHQDKVVSVPRMLEMYDQLGTPENLKQKIAFPDVANHGLLNRYFSEDVESVIDSSILFVENVILGR